MSFYGFIVYFIIQTKSSFDLCFQVIKSKERQAVLSRWTEYCSFLYSFTRKPFLTTSVRKKTLQTYRSYGKRSNKISRQTGGKWWIKSHRNYSNVEKKRQYRYSQSCVGKFGIPENGKSHWSYPFEKGEQEVLSHDMPNYDSYVEGDPEPQNTECRVQSRQENSSSTDPS